MLLKIKAETERIMKAAMPGFRLFRYRPEAFEAAQMPFIHVFFHEDHLIERKGFSDERRVTYEIEACFVPEEDAESEIMVLLNKIESALRLSDALEKITSQINLSHVDFGHKKVGEQRIAALLMCWHIDYLKAYPERVTTYG